ncbi:hypothetical protein M5689_014354 [Euphorbia peplus]|nr:hypothetical protein M5689_014354 [Euphorbia peplus]
MVSLMRIFLILTVIITLFFNNIITSAISVEEEVIDHYELETSDKKSSFQRQLVRFHIPKKPKSLRMKCNKLPTLCHARGSPGPNCCKNKCVNVLNDRNNCGQCGKKCKYSEICCHGNCVNPSFNKKHCGGCNNKCKHGHFCAFGLCNYA